MTTLTLVLALVAIACSFTVESANNYGYYNYFRQSRQRQQQKPQPQQSSYKYFSSYTPTTVGFTVAKTVNQEFSAAGVITFDKTITNVGKAFQASDSKVKIPTTGLYYFSFSVRTNSTDLETINLLKNGEVVATAMGLTAASSAVVFARKGDKVSVNAGALNLIESSVANPKTTFSGFLIKSGYFDSDSHRNSY